MGRARGVLLALLVLAPVAAAAAPGPEERRLVTFHGAVPALLPGVRVLDAFPFAGVALVEGPADALLALARLPGVAGVYPEESLTPLLDEVRQAVRAEPQPGEAWPRGGSVSVALVDSGIDFQHPGFAGRVEADVRISRGGIVSSGRGDADGHGTHVAGIVAGSGARSVDERLRGLAPGARLVGVDISDSFTTTSAVRAFEWVHEHRGEHGIKVVTNSWGREKDDAHYDPDDPVIRASDALVADGIVVVFSAGNRGRDGHATLTSEAMNPNVLTVGASTLGGKAESYSSKGPARDGEGKRLSWTKPDLVAPGTAVVSARTSANAPPGNGEDHYYVTMNGTSMAAPQVAAAAALLLDERPDLSPSLVAELLVRTARDVGPAGPDDDAGYGLLDVRAALAAARGVGAEPDRIVIERLVPVHQSGSVAAAQGLVLLAGGAPQVPPSSEVQLPLHAPAGAARADLWFNWSGPGDFDVRLQGPGGEWAFQRVAPGALHLARPLRSGEHVLLVRPVGVAANTPYALEGSVVVREEHAVEPVPAEFHSRPTSGPVGGFLDAQDRAVTLLGANAQKLIALLVSLSCGVAAVGLRQRR